MLLIGRLNWQHGVEETQGRGRIGSRRGKKWGGKPIQLGGREKYGEKNCERQERKKVKGRKSR